MQLLVEAREHIDHYEFSQAIEKCKSAISSNEQTFEAYRILLEVLKISKNSDYKKYHRNFLLYLNQNNDIEKFYHYYKKLISNNESVSISLRIHFLKSIWELGRLSEFNNECEALHAYCIDQKYFNRLQEVIDLIETYSKKNTYLLRGKIIFYCEINDEKSLEVVLGEYLDKNVYSKKNWSSIDEESLVNMKDILELYKDQSVVNAREYNRCRIISDLIKKSNKKTDMKTKIDFLLQANDFKDFYLLFEREEHLIIEDALGIYIKSKLKQKLNLIPYLFSKSRALFSSTVTMAVVEHNHSIESEDVLEAPDMYELFPEQGKIVSKQHDSKRLTSKLEKELITQINYEQYTQETLNELIISFIEMELYHTALELCKKLDKTSNKYYLEAQVNLNLYNYSEVIVIVNSVFSKFNLSNIENTPFQYLKAVAYQRLNNPEKAHELFKLIAMSDPNFMDVRGKLRR